ncbi:thiosulfate/3-mercaptopyruvate sulfurtransferase [Bacillus pakistanensis]|uniref:Thiosulfate/3-mercaptopyruvate sulfurtransferase n=1 Tax=Rossellomorea pakistanensis TaxID=992288 RepID=A0ABS2N8U9_9BACI|nr:sulfurtransferase [Bacillus pakistanensis]MBM7584281.1 thiosulfate/3-mercaptopyruvate sulfurtransferase [Bacillus pakistanensis]
MNFVSVQWLSERYQNDNVRVIDCRFSLQNPKVGHGAYLRDHIPGAVYFNLDKDLSSEISNHGGRHPLPDLAQFIRKIEKAGINQDTAVVAYDDKEGAFASRLWWLMKYIGHKKVFILDGGYQAWKRFDQPTDALKPAYHSSVYTPHIQTEMVVTMEDVKEFIRNEKAGTLIDSRATERYLGKEEPIDRIPGHIPTAQNIVWTEGFKDSHWKSASEQKKRFKDLDENSPIIVYCGSGVTAIPNYIALKEAGFTDVKLYAGSYSDWVSYEENEVRKGNK